QAEAIPGEHLDLEIHVDPRVRSSLRAVQVSLPFGEDAVDLQPTGVGFAVQKARSMVPPHAQPAPPPWLNDAAASRYPWEPKPLVARFTLQAGEEVVTVERPVRYVWDEPVAGERFSWVQIAPPVTVTPELPVTMLPNGG